MNKTVLAMFLALAVLPAIALSQESYTTATMAQSNDPMYNLWLVYDDRSLVPSADIQCWNTALNGDRVIVIHDSLHMLNGAALRQEVVDINKAMSAWGQCANNASTTFAKHLAAYHGLRDAILKYIVILATHSPGGVSHESICGVLQEALNGTTDENYLHVRIGILFSEEVC